METTVYKCPVCGTNFDTEAACGVCEAAHGNIADISLEWKPEQEKPSRIRILMETGEVQWYRSEQYT